jgi:prepilin-type N-terminal cleavage/methylation domain-containing protein
MPRPLCFRFRFASFPGFTLIELLLVMIILGVITGMVVPSFGNTYKNFVLRSTVDDVVFVMRSAQAQAVSRRVAYRLSFSQEGTSYQLTRAVSRDEDGRNKFEGVPGRWGRVFTLPAGLAAIPEKAVMAFFPDGTIEKNRISVISGQRSMTISTYEQRGYVLAFDNEAGP